MGYDVSFHPISPEEMREWYFTPLTWIQQGQEEKVLALAAQYVYGDNVFEKDGIRRDRTGDGEKTRCLCGKRGIFNRDGPAMGPQIIRQLERRASRRSASFFHALASPGRPRNGGGASGAYHNPPRGENLDTRPFSGARRAAWPVPEVTAADKEDGLRGP